jgi:hypothetical protein
MRRRMLSFSILTLAAVACRASAPVATSPVADTQPPSVATVTPTLVGTWELVSTRVTRGDTVLLEVSAPKIRAIKILNATDYSVVTLRGEQFMRAGTGRYTLNGNEYVETVELASGRFTPGRAYTFRIDVNGDTWTTDGGQGLELFHEVWRRVR